MVVLARDRGGIIPIIMSFQGKMDVVISDVQVRTLSIFLGVWTALGIAVRCILRLLTMSITLDLLMV